MTLDVPAGQVLALVGPSGCGKWTLLELVCGLQEPTPARGTVDRGRRAVRSCPRATRCCPGAGAGQRRAGAASGGRRRAEARASAPPPCSRPSASAASRVRPAELSGGMRQRVAFARTLLAGAPVLCLDEPFGALDAITRAETQEWLRGALAAEPRTVLLVTHDVEEAVLLADRIAVLSPRPGRVVADLAGGPAAPARRDRPGSSRCAAVPWSACADTRGAAAARRARRVAALHGRRLDRPVPPARPHRRGGLAVGRPRPAVVEPHRHRPGDGRRPAGGPGRSASSSPSPCTSRGPPAAPPTRC